MTVCICIFYNNLLIIFFLHKKKNEISSISVSYYIFQVSKKEMYRSARRLDFTRMPTVQPSYPQPAEPKFKSARRLNFTDQQSNKQKMEQFSIPIPKEVEEDYYPKTNM